jgi:hypothetical protein
MFQRLGVGIESRIFEIKDGRKNYYEAGVSFLETDSDQMHIVGNDTRDGATTFHVYVPELKMPIFPDDEADIAVLNAQTSFHVALGRGLIGGGDFTLSIPK